MNRFPRYVRPYEIGESNIIVFKKKNILTHFVNVYNICRFSAVQESFIIFIGFYEERG